MILASAPLSPPRLSGFARDSSTRRAGLSLIEVLVSLAIFLMSLVALGQLVSIGTDRALDVQERSQASTYCRSALAQVIAGIVPITGQGTTAFDDDPNWSWSVDSEPDSAANLYHVTITVTRQRSDSTQAQFTISQWMLDPASRGSTASTPPPTAADASSTTGGSNSSNPSGSGSTPTGGSNSPKSGSPSSSGSKPGSSGSTGPKGGGSSTPPSAGGSKSGGSTPSGGGTGSKGGGSSTPSGGGARGGGSTPSGGGNSGPAGGGSRGGPAGGAPSAGGRP